MQAGPVILDPKLFSQAIFHSQFIFNVSFNLLWFGLRSADCNKFWHMPPQHGCRVMWEILNESKIWFPSKLNYDWEIIDEMGPRAVVQGPQKHIDYWWVEEFSIKSCEIEEMCAQVNFYFLHIVHISIFVIPYGWIGNIILHEDHLRLRCLWLPAWWALLLPWWQ